MGIMVPVDMSCLGDDFQDVTEMQEKLGAKGTCESFIKARKHFEATKDNLPEDERPGDITWVEWQSMINTSDEGFEEELFEGEEEEDGEEDEAEPAAKKQKGLIN